MISSETAAKPHIKKRTIGTYATNKAGPVVIFVVGLHGNEPAGIVALKAVLDQLNILKPTFKGSLIGLAGNITALERKERFIDEDMNRNWDSYLAEVYPTHDALSKHAEDTERRALTKELTRIISGTKENVFLCDLHTTSSESVPFISINDTLRNREFVKNIPSPIILGLAEQIKGTLNGAFNDLGIASVLFESGQHDDLSSIENHEAFIWLILEQLGCINPVEIPKFHKYREILGRLALDGRKIYEVFFRHGIDTSDHFKMEPGFVNFQKIKKGTRLAHDKNGAIKAFKNGRLFMPLYQGKGDDGFFLIRGISPFWLKVSERLRKLKFDKYLHWLPGVRKDQSTPNTFIIDRKIALFYSLQIFHLMGYRKKEVKKGRLFVSRLPYDDETPSNEEIIKNFDYLTSRS